MSAAPSHPAPPRMAERQTEGRPVGVRSLQDLQSIRQHLAERRRQAALLEARRQEAQHRADAEENLFVRAAGTVQPLRQAARAPHWTDPPPPVPVQQQLDDQKVLLQSLSDEFDASTLLDVDDAMSYRRSGIGTDVTRRLRKGEWSIQRELDLHGLRRDDAREALSAFIRDAHRRGLRCLRVVHGKGLGSPGRVPVLKSKVHSWLIQKNEVMAFVQARADEGGAGALVVLLTST